MKIIQHFNGNNISATLFWLKKGESYPGGTIKQSQGFHIFIKKEFKKEKYRYLWIMKKDAIIDAQQLIKKENKN